MSRCAFNCYRHQIQLVICIEGTSVIFILSKEGVAQGNPFAMALYGIMFLLLIMHLRQISSKVPQPWFVNDGAMDGEGSQVTVCFIELNQVGPMIGYYPEVNKSLLV